MTITIYHNPRCSKSREALGLIQQKGVEPEIVLYLQTPPTATDLLKLMEQHGIAATELVRFKEDQAEALGISASDKRSNRDWAELLAAHPILIERPIVINNNRALVCRPPEKVLELV